MLGVDRNVRKGMGALLGGLLACIGGCYKGCDEFGYLGGGEEAKGSVVSVEEWKEGRRMKLLVKFSFTDAAGKRGRGEALLPMSSEIAPGDEVDVEHIPGKKGSARLAAEGGVGGVLFLMAAGAGLAIYGALRLSRHQPG
jgi:hypothetical protein